MIVRRVCKFFSLKNSSSVEVHNKPVPMILNFVSFGYCFFFDWKWALSLNFWSLLFILFGTDKLGLDVKLLFVSKLNYLFFSQNYHFAAKKAASKNIKLKAIENLKLTRNYKITEQSIQPLE